jgi:hypothetical protein
MSGSVCSPLRTQIRKSFKLKNLAYELTRRMVPVQVLISVPAPARG